MIIPPITGRVSTDNDVLIPHLIAWLKDSYERIPYADTHETYNTYERRLKAAWEALVSLGVENPGDYL